MGDPRKASGRQHHTHFTLKGPPTCLFLPKQNLLSLTNFSRVDAELPEKHAEAEDCSRWTERTRAPADMPQTQVEGNAGQASSLLRQGVLPQLLQPPTSHPIPVLQEQVQRSGCPTTGKRKKLSWLL